jgi:AcrR family transcriptional regulator
MPTMLDSENVGTLPPGLALAWGVAPTARRGPKPAHSVEQIIDAAMALADADGFAAASLPNIAAELGFTTNALYRYVSSKEELVVLLADAGWGPPPDDLNEYPDWRDGARAWTHAVIDRYHARTWLLDIPVRGAPTTPNLLRWTEILLQALACSGLRGDSALGCALLLDGFARSTALRSRSRLEGSGSPARTDAVRAFLLPKLTERDYPKLAEMVEDGSYPSDAVETVDFGLDRLLDGISVLVGQLPKATAQQSNS